MQGERKISLYIDIDNLKIGYNEYDDAIKQLEMAGDILHCKVYGVSDRRHKEIISSIMDRGYDMAPVMRKRRPKQFDYRIIVDVMEDVLQNNNINTVVIIACPTDLVWLYSKLNSYNIKVIALDNNDEENRNLVDEVIHLGLHEPDPAPKKAPEPVKPAKAVPPPKKAKTPVAPTKTEPQVAATEELQTIKEVAERPNTEENIDKGNEELLQEIKGLLDKFKEEE
ncbi:MAG: NYN domain-containing protein [Clostridia bacterium]|nr:NYN domain-containing protein [Clostridia bacterium]